ncbi:MAG: MarR family transcriptional regulator [Candidatus Aminicenantes bacterium]|nr:MarR family transcriptional regulator [Candidatus Aminicenantes bacterium]
MNIEKIKNLRGKLRILEREEGGVFEEPEGCCGLTTAQCHTLLEIGSRGQVSLVDLAAALGLDASTLSRTIQGMVMQCLVSRQPNDKDRRYVVISLTEHGRKVFSEIEDRYNGYIARVLGLLPADKQETILESIGAFADAVLKLKETESCCDEGERA